MLNEIVEVIFRTDRVDYFINSDDLTIEPDMDVIVQADRGEDIAKIINCSIMEEELQIRRKKGELKKIYRVVSENDLKSLENVKEKEKDAAEKFNELLAKQPFEMKLIDSIYQFDGNKLTFFFAAEGRVDFRDFVRELATEFKTRIELHQTSGREDARRYGGLGVCGKTYCCVRWLKKFNQVSIQMAKDQQLLSNLTKISGPCGRLLCCLQYEEDFYLEKAKSFPPINTNIVYNKMKMQVVKNDFLGDRVHLYSHEDKVSKIISLEEYYSLKYGKYDSKSGS